MCNSKRKTGSEIDGRRVLQPACNRISIDDQKTRPTLKKSLSFPNKVKPTKRCNDVTCSSLNSSTEKAPSSPKPFLTSTKSLPVVRKKPKSNTTTSITNQSQLQPSIITVDASSLNYKSISSLLEDGVPGSLAAAQREQAAIMHEKRKMRIAHYGRTGANSSARAPGSKVVPADEAPTGTGGHEEKRCSFITPNSDPAYVAYHDEEWGVPVHDDKKLFELLVLSGAQVGLDWTTILKKRDDFRAAFRGFDAEAVSKLTEKQMVISISEEYGIDLARVRGVVDNSKCILEIKKDFGTLDKYLWGFVNNKPISPQYRFSRKIPVKTSKSESISKDMVRRGFRFVGPTIVHSFMQAAGLTNDHLVSCPHHSKCSVITN